MSQSVCDVMTRSVIIAHPEEKAGAVAARLAQYGISALPVCDADGHVLGVISEGDLMRPFTKAHELKRDWWLSLLAEGSALAPAFLAYIRQDGRPVRDLMTAPARTAPETMTLAEAADELIRHRIKRLPVVHDGKLVGVVSRADLVQALYRQA